MAERVSVFAPATVGNVGPGFDILGLAVDGLGDIVRAEEAPSGVALVEISGRGAERVPQDPEKNTVCIAARAMLSQLGEARGVRLWLQKGLPLSGGLGGSAASSVGGAMATALALGRRVSLWDIVKAALVGESAVSGPHLDNIAPCVFGGLTLVRATEPPDILKLGIRKDWWVALCTPALELETKAMRAVLPASSPRAEWIQQSANAAALVHAFSSGDAALCRRALDDVFAEPRRAPMIPRFREVKAAALQAGALGCSISGAGPTIFALAEGPAPAESCLLAMQEALGAQPSLGHIGRITRRGAHSL